MESTGGVKINIMINQEIKTECEKAYEQISLAQERLKELRAICKHEHTTERPYAWRVGSYDIVNVCDYCGENCGTVTNEIKKEEPLLTVSNKFCTIRKTYIITEHYNGEKPNTEVVIYDNLPKPFQDRINEALANNNVSSLRHLKFETEEEDAAYEDNNSLQYLYTEFDTPAKRKNIFAGKSKEKFFLAGKLDFYHFY